MKILLLLAVMSVRAFGQNQALLLPDAPDPQPATHSLNQRVHFLSNRETMTRKSMWAYDLTDVLSGVFDAEMSHAGLAHRRCPEAHGLNSRWQLYRNNLPEQGAVIAFGFLATKTRMPRWLMFGTIVYPIEVHLRAGIEWYTDCW